ncbi:hypothetical protein EVAR_30685_1 [Eumeta japonica]|uniref:Uncharacterized protein n=1 Tax=Eumeta variegata TaxID=151549 RepID=A0A4C1VSC9_EUMVA|nr:hypothetical protein EVAR_30685_1 [Eumeta japonica]
MRQLDCFHLRQLAGGGARTPQFLLLAEEPRSLASWRAPAAHFTRRPSDTRDTRREICRATVAAPDTRTPGERWTATVRDASTFSFVSLRPGCCISDTCRQLARPLSRPGGPKFQSPCLDIPPQRTAAICLCLWGTSWFLLKETVLPGGYLFSMSTVVITGYIFGHTLERFTTIPPLVGMTLIGAIYRNFGPTNFLENAVANDIDYHLRRLYPVIILTKGPLTWNWDYIKSNPCLVFSLATLPWTAECLSIAIFSNILMSFPWYWGEYIYTSLYVMVKAGCNS